MKDKPAIALLVGKALADKGMKKTGMDSKDEEMESEDNGEYLQDIASDMIKAIQDKDPVALADLLKEAFTCLEAEPHEEYEE